MAIEFNKYVIAESRSGVPLLLKYS